ncbi:MAG: hypothetical protein KA810_09560, partial [Pyrinomonadaceae bacterium]|nr:hypothetical protein [Pyrinomonadaceae bacterium]
MPWVIGTFMVATLALLIILQSTNLWKTFTIESSSDLLLLYALSSLNFVAFVIFAFIFLRSIIKLIRERRTFQLGAQIKTRLLIYFFAVSLLPIIAMAVFSYLFMNRALERWFSQIPQNVARSAQDLQRSSAEDRQIRMVATAKMIADAFDERTPDEADLLQLAADGRLSYVEITLPSGSKVSSKLPGDEKLASGVAPIIDAFRRGENNASSFADGIGLEAAVANMSGGKRLLIVPDPVTTSNIGQIAAESLKELDRLGQQQLTIRRIGLLTLGVLTFLLISASSWIAFH